MVANGLTFVFWIITNVIFDDTNEVITTCVIWALVIFTLMYCILKTEENIIHSPNRCIIYTNVRYRWLITNDIWWRYIGLYIYIRDYQMCYSK